MKNLLAAFLILSTFAVSAQSKDTKSSRKQAKKERKEEKRRILAQKLDSVEVLITERSFAITNQQFDDNFIKIDGDDFFCQTISLTRVGGDNGLGGTTISGKVKGYDIQQVDKMVNVTMTVFTPVRGTVNIFLSVSPLGWAVAHFNYNSGAQGTFHGLIKPIDDVSQFQGVLTRVARSTLYPN